MAPILQRMPQCHRPNSLPMSLLSSEDARPWARSIKYRTAATQGRHAALGDIGIQDYKNARR